jgi:hypothetical protein
MCDPGFEGRFEIGVVDKNQTALTQPYRLSLKDHIGIYPRG